MKTSIEFDDIKLILLPEKLEEMILYQIGKYLDPMGWFYMAIDYGL